MERTGYDELVPRRKVHKITGFDPACEINKKAVKDCNASPKSIQGKEPPQRITIQCIQNIHIFNIEGNVFNPSFADLTCCHVFHQNSQLSNLLSSYILQLTTNNQH